MENGKSINSMKYYIITFILSLLYGLIHTLLFYNATDIDIFLLLAAFGFSIGLIAISLLISAFICLINMIFIKKWKNFSKTLFYTNFVFIIFLYLGSIVN